MEVISSKEVRRRIINQNCAVDVTGHLWHRIIISSQMINGIECRIKIEYRNKKKVKLSERVVDVG